MDVTPITAGRRKKMVAKRNLPETFSDSDSDSSSCDADAFLMKKRKIDVDPPSPEEKTATAVNEEKKSAIRQFWKAGDYEEDFGRDSSNESAAVGGGMDHLRVHPRFLHSNATSHKWALGALAELLDNSLDEVCNGATYVNVDVIINKKHNNNSKMLVVEDNGGGMTPDKLRQCMSLGYSLKSKLANTIGQYGNGFKTSTMRLGADVIVFSRCPSANGTMTQSIGMLSYTFLRATGKEDIVVPMIDFKRESSGGDWKKLIRSSSGDWSRNLGTILEWSPYTSEEELLQQFNSFEDHGTRIVIYNLWEDDEGELEMDFDTDEFDIQMRGANRDELKIEMAKVYPNSKHFLTYRHSLRSYASILYLRIPPGFKMILRGKEIEHHNVANDLFLIKELTYKPMITDPTIRKNDPNMVATVTIGFVKDAKAHFDIQGFNVYHKNRLIKPFWRVWNAAGSDGRGVIGVLEANFVEPAHDKQGFERTTALARLERKLIEIQKDFWSTNCQEIGYAARRNKKAHASEAEKTPISDKEKLEKSSTPPTMEGAKNNSSSNGNSKVESSATMKEKKSGNPPKEAIDVTYAEPISTWNPNGRMESRAKQSTPKVAAKTVVGNADKAVVNSKGEDETSNKVTKTDKSVESLVRSLEEEQEKRKELETKLELAEQKIEQMDKENETLISIFSEERSRRDAEEDELRKQLKDASNTIKELLDKVKSLES